MTALASRGDVETTVFASGTVESNNLVSVGAQVSEQLKVLKVARGDSPIDGVVVAIVTKEGQTVNTNQSAPTIIKVARLDRMTIKVEISELTWSGSNLASGFTSTSSANRTPGIAQNWWLSNRPRS